MELLDVDINRRINDPYGEERKGGGGSTDVANVAWNTPTQEFGTAYFITGGPGHSWQAVAVGGTSIGHKSTVYASKVMAATAIDLMMNLDIVKAAKEDWAKRMEGQKYVSPLPSDLKPPLDQLE
jgi:aminobenzoyl-glutamate utilization protein B